MSARATRRGTAAAFALTATLTAGTAALLTGCGPTDSTAATVTQTDAASIGTAPANSATTVPVKGSGPAKGGTSGAGQAPVVVPDAAGSAGLTISNGTRFVREGGTTVDFGTAVSDLAWSPSGGKAAFIDGSGDLAVTGPNGSGRVVVARHRSGESWSHPTWQVTHGDAEVPAKDNLLFAVRANDVSRLETVSATAVNGAPKTLSIYGYAGENTVPPKTGNVWPNAGGTHGTSVYANSGNGEVYIRDDYLRQQGGELAPGSEPAMSPTDNEEIVFVRSVGGHDHLFVETGNAAGNSAKDITPHATVNYTEPAWSPDGKHIAARTSAGIVVLPANGATAPVLVSSHSGLPAYRA